MTVQTILRRISITSLFLIPLFALFPMNFWPFNFPNLMFFPFITGKAFYFRILVEVVFSSWVILAFLDPRYRPRLTPLTVSVSLFALIALIADLLGVNPVRSIFSNFERMEGWLAVFHLWMFYISAVHVFGIGEEGRRMWHRWLNVTVIVAVIVAFYGYLQLAGVLETHQGSRVDASLGNAAYMAVYMLMNTGIVAYLFFVARAKQIANAGFLQWLYPILTVAFGFLVVATATRGTTLGLIGGIMLACALYAVFGRGESVKLRWTSAGVIVFIILIGILFWTNRHASFIQKNEVLSRMASISLSETSNQARQFIWPMAINGAMQRPILGWGQENFNYIFNKDYNPLMWRQEQWFDRAHSVFLDWLTASGIVGLLSYLSLYVLFLITVWKSSLTKGEKSVLTGLLAGYAVHNIFVFDNLASYVFFFVILGFVGSLVRADAIPSKLGKINTWLAQKNFSKDAVEYIVAPIVLVAFVAGIYFLNVRAIQANTRLITALSACGREQTANPKLFANALSVSPIADQEVREQILSCSGNIIGGQAPGPTKQAFFELASKAIQDQITVAPKDARMYVIGGTFLNAFNQTAQALPILEKAHELTPGKQTASIQLATAYINLGRKDDAVSLLKQVYESDPSNEEAKSAYVIGLILVNKDAEAHKMFDPNPTFESERVAQVYLAIKQYDKAISILKKLVAATPTDVNLRAKLAQAYNSAGMNSLAVDTLRAVEKDHPEYKDQIEAAIKQMQAPK